VVYSLDRVSVTDSLHALEWRNQHLEGLRTPWMLTEDRQRRFHADVIANPDARARYWSVKDDTGLFVALVGLNPIQWENRIAEISLVTNPERRGHGIGTAAVDLVFEHGFGQMGLSAIWGECYHCNGALGFWTKIVARYQGHSTTIPSRKMWRGVLHAATWFTIDEFGWRSVYRAKQHQS